MASAARVAVLHKVHPAAWNCGTSEQHDFVTLAGNSVPEVEQPDFVSPQVMADTCAQISPTPKPRLLTVLFWQGPGLMCLHRLHPAPFSSPTASQPAELSPYE